MSNGEQGAGGVAEGPQNGCGCDNDGERKALKEVAEAKTKVAEAEVEIEQAIRDERAADHLLEKAEADLEEARHREVIHFEVDGEPHETKQRMWTPNAIIKDFGKQDPATNYLVRIGGHDEADYRGKGEIPIEIHECDRFQVIPIGAAPVSDGTRRTGIEVFIAGLKNLGFEPVPLKDTTDRIFFDYKVPTGKYAGRQFRLGLIVPQDFPLTAPGGLHVSPRIHANRGGQVHPADGIQDSPDFQKGAGGEWHYWSRPYNEWGKTKKTVSAYMNHVFRLWDTQ